MKLDTLIEGCLRLCGCKNGSSLTSNYRVISLSNFCNNKFVWSISLKIIVGIKWNLAHWEKAMKRRALCKNQHPFTSYYVVIFLPDFPSNRLFLTLSQKLYQGIEWNWRHWCKWIFICCCCLLSLCVLHLYVYFKIKITMTNLTWEVSQRVGRCGQTDLVLDKGGVKISTRNCPLSPWGIIS